MVQLLQPYMTTGKTIVLTVWTFVSRVMSLLFNTLSRFVIAFLPRSNHLLISWLQSPSLVILEPKKKKSVTISTFSPSICHDVMGLVAMILVFLIFSFKPALSLSSFTLIKSTHYVLHLVGEARDIRPEGPRSNWPRKLEKFCIAQSRRLRGSIKSERMLGRTGQKQKATFRWQLEREGETI